MSDTVNLKNNPKKDRLVNRNGFIKNNRDRLDEIYRDEYENNRKIIRPKEQRINENFLRNTVWLLALILISFSLYFLFLKPDLEKNSNNENNEASWYAVRLINDEIYYGRLDDVTTDPIVLNNVYYNYEQLKDGVVNPETISNLRLVKRGNETHGPDGKMNIVRAQILYMESLKADSKVLRAIREYEQ